MNKKNQQNKKIARRRRKVAIRRSWYFLRIFLLAAFFAAAIFGLNYFYHSSYFKISEISVEGNQHYSRQDMAEHLSGYHEKNIFEIDKKDVEEQLLSEFSWLKEAELRKVFPSKLIIALTERRPHIKAYFRGQVFLLDAEGVVLEKMDAQEAEKMQKLVLVKNALNYSPEPGDKVAIRNALSCGDIYGSMDNELRALFGQAELNQAGEIIFIAKDGRRVNFGDSVHLPQKISILRELLKDEAQYTTIDLKNYEIPVIN